MDMYELNKTNHSTGIVENGENDDAYKTKNTDIFFFVLQMMLPGTSDERLIIMLTTV